MTGNNTVEISIKGKTYTLMFGRAAAEEITRRLVNERRLGGANFHIVVNLMYGGLVNYAIYNDLDMPTWADVYELAEDFHDEENSMEQYDLMYNVFKESRWGQEVIATLEKAEVKIEELISEITEADGKA